MHRELLNMHEREGRSERDGRIFRSASLLVVAYPRARPYVADKIDKRSGLPLRVNTIIAAE